MASSDCCVFLRSFDCCSQGSRLVWSGPHLPQVCRSQSEKRGFLGLVAYVSESHPSGPSPAAAALFQSARKALARRALIKRRSLASSSTRAALSRLGLAVPRSIMNHRVANETATATLSEPRRPEACYRQERECHVDPSTCSVDRVFGVSQTPHR